MSLEVLLHCDGANGSTTFDNGGLGGAVTPAGACQLSTAQQRFGSASGRCSAPGDYLILPPVMHLSTWQIEGFFRFASNPANSTQTLFTQYNSPDAGRTYFTMDHGGPGYYNPAAGEIVGNFGGAVADQWYHIALVRDGSGIHYYVNGVAYVNSGNFTPPANSVSLVVGGPASVGSFDGWFDEIRVLAGQITYTGDFTPPSAPFGGGAVVLGGAASAHATASGALSVPSDIAGAAQGNAAASGALNISNQIGGAAVASATAAGVLVEITAPLRVTVATHAYAPRATLRVWVHAPAYTMSAPLAVSVALPSYAPSAPMLVSVGEPLAPTAPLRVTVAPPGLFSPGSGSFATRWRPVLVLGGVDLSSRLTGALNVEMAEGSARVAEFALLPYAGPVALDAWVGQTVAIDHVAIDSAGGVLSQLRIFTGVVDVPEYDVRTRVTRFRCTDALQEVSANADRATLGSLIGGRWTRAVFADEQADGWRYAQDNISTVPAAYDMSPHGAIRVTPWAPGAPERTLTESDIEDGTLAVAWADRATLRNRVDVDFRYRFLRAKLRTFPYRWVYPFSLGEIVRHGYTIPTADMVLSALRGTGWEIVGTPKIVHPPRGPLQIDMGGWYAIWITSDQDLQAQTTIGETQRFNAAYAISDQDVAEKLVFSVAATMQRRYVQSIEEAYTLSVTHAPSIAAFGEASERIASSLSVEWNSQAWEAWRPPEVPAGSWDLGASSVATPPAPVIVPSATGDAYVDYAPDTDTDRAAATGAMEALIAIASAKIWGSHRRHGVRATLPLDPSLDVCATIAVATAEVSATGKLRRVAHMMDIESGRAATEIEIAIAASAGAGTADAVIAPAPPAVPAMPYAAAFGGQQTHVGSSVTSAPLSSDMTGYFTNVALLSSNYAASAPVYPTQFIVEAPAIENAARDNLTLDVTAAYRVQIPQDTFYVEA